MSRVLTAADIDAAGGDPTARATLAALQALLTNNALFYNTKKLLVSDTPIADPATLDIQGVPAQFYRQQGYYIDGGGGIGSLDFGTGVLQIKWSDNTKGITDIHCKGRGSAIGAKVALIAGDQIYQQLWYGNTGTVVNPNGYFAHAGWYRVGIDGAPLGDPTEIPGWYGLATGTGIGIVGSRYAFAVNSKQQVNFPGPVSSVLGPTGTSWGANIVFGIGTISAGGAPFKFTLTSAAILTVPEAGAFEWDATGSLYFTNAAGKRGQIRTADVTAVNTIAAGTGAGTGPTVTLVNGPNGGRITVLTGTVPTLGGTIAALTYGTAFGTNSFVSLTPSNVAAAAIAGNFYAGGSSVGFNLKNTGVALAATTTYIWEFTYTGF